jgi:transcription antitermination factor NusG
VLDQWVLVRTQSGRENWARVNVENQGARTFLPKVEVGTKGSLEVLFPGYLFVEVSTWGHAFLRGTFGVIGFVPSNERIERVPRRVMDHLFAIVNEEGYVPLPTQRPLHKKELVIVDRGSFKNFLGVYIGDTGDKRNEVLLHFMGREVKATFERHELRPVKD